MLEISLTAISYELDVVYFYHAQKYSTLAKFLSLFQEGSDNLNDELRLEQPTTVHSNANIESVRGIIKENSHANSQRTW